SAAIRLPGSRAVDRAAGAARNPRRVICMRISRGLAEQGRWWVNAGGGAVRSWTLAFPAYSPASPGAIGTRTPVTIAGAWSRRLPATALHARRHGSLRQLACGHG